VNKIALVKPEDATPAPELLLLKEKTEAPERPLPAEKPPAPTIVSQKPAGSPPKPPARPKRKRRLGLLIAAALAVTAGSWFGYHWWTTGRFIVSTDDAYVGPTSPPSRPASRAM
jgi:membrane fusion protein (multidrug efflux system)